MKFPDRERSFGVQLSATTAAVWYNRPMIKAALRSLWLSSIVIALLALSGCARSVKTGPSPDNYLRLAMSTEPTTFDPAMVEDGPTIDMLQQIYEGLVQWTPQNTLAPALATSWSVSKDGRTYTFHLRPGVKFQSGDPVTAQAVATSLSRSLARATGSPVGITYLGDIVGAQTFNAGKAKTLSGVKVIDALTIQIAIQQPKAYWLNVLTYPTAYVINPNAVAKDAQGRITDINTDGTGPFKLLSHQSGISVELAANTSYWQGPPAISGQHRLIVTDAQTRHSMYVDGDLDIVDETSGALAADEATPVLESQIKQFNRAATYYVSLNQNPKAGFAPFKDIRVRQAFAYATDKKRIVDIVFAGRRDIAQDILPEGIPGFDASFRALPYDPAKARSLMAAAGYPGGQGFPPLPIAYRESNPDLGKTVDLLRQMYQENLGVTVMPQQTEWSALLSADDNGVLPSVHMRWSADYLDPQDFYSLLYHTGSEENRLGYSNPMVDSLCDKADSEQDPTTRIALYRQVEEILQTDFSRIPLYYQRDAELIKPYVGGLQDSLMGHLPYRTVVLKK